MMSTASIQDYHMTECRALTWFNTAISAILASYVPYVRSLQPQMVHNESS